MYSGAHEETVARHRTDRVEKRMGKLKSTDCCAGGQLYIFASGVEI